MKPTLDLSTVVNKLRVDLRNYDGIKKLMVTIQNRTKSINADSDPKNEDTFRLLVKYKNDMKREIETALKGYFPVWNEWLVNVPGVGPYVAGNLIMLFYYKFVPICKKCGSDIVITEKVVDGKRTETYKCPKCGDVKGDGNLEHRIAEKDFPKISNWWSYCGRAPVDGKLPKRKKGEQLKFSPRGRQISWEFTEQVNRHPDSDPYKAFLLREKAILEEKHPEKSKGHRHNMAKNKTAKLFLSHFWKVARMIDGKPITEPYSMSFLGHVGIIDPFYWNTEEKNAA